MPGLGFAHAGCADSGALRQCQRCWTRQSPRQGALGLSPQCPRLWSQPPLPRETCQAQRQGQPWSLGYIQRVLRSGLVCLAPGSGDCSRRAVQGPTAVPAAPPARTRCLHKAHGSVYLLHMEQTRTLLPRGLAPAKGRNTREKFYSVDAQFVFLKQEQCLRRSVVCVLIIHLISLLSTTGEMLQLPHDLAGCQAQVNPFHLHQMQHSK